MSDEEVVRQEPVESTRTTSGREQCRPVTVTDVDGQEITVSVLGAEQMDEVTRGHFGEMVRAAQRKYRREHPEAP